MQQHTGAHTDTRTYKQRSTVQTQAHRQGRYDMLQAHSCTKYRQAHLAPLQPIMFGSQQECLCTYGHHVPLTFVATPCVFQGLQDGATNQRQQQDVHGLRPHKDIIEEGLCSGKKRQHEQGGAAEQQSQPKQFTPPAVRACALLRQGVLGWRLSPNHLVHTCLNLHNPLRCRRLHLQLLLSILGDLHHKEHGP